VLAADGVEADDMSWLGITAGVPLPLLQPAARTSTAAAEMEKRVKRLFMLDLS
jgi:hypothetical protein